MDDMLKFECQVHGRQVVVLKWKDAFVLECGCAYRLSDAYGIKLVNSTSTLPPPKAEDAKKDEFPF